MPDLRFSQWTTRADTGQITLESLPEDLSKQAAFDPGFPKWKRQRASGAMRVVNTFAEEQELGIHWEDMPTTTSLFRKWDGGLSWDQSSNAGALYSRVG